MSKPTKHLRRHPYGHRRCWCKAGKMLGKPKHRDKRETLKGTS